MIEMLFFYDGPLTDIATTDMESEDLVDAKDGYSNNMAAMRKLIKDDKVHLVLSNQIKVLDNMLLWDHVAHRPKLCFLDKSDGKWKPAGRFIKKELKYIHNLEKMFLNGEFAEKAYKINTRPKRPKPRPKGVYLK